MLAPDHLFGDSLNGSAPTLCEENLDRAISSSGVQYEWKTLAAWWARPAATDDRV